MKTSSKRGTYRITFSNGRQIVLGNNYKPWWQHAIEYIYRFHGNKSMAWRYEDIKHLSITLEYSNQPFYDDGGLKWCSFETYQQIIDFACERDKLVPVKASKIVFESAPADMAVLTKKLKEY